MKKDHFPSLKDFKRLAKKGNVIPVYRELLADSDTPVSAFRKLDTDPYAFLLESVEGQENLARYSFLGSKPSMIVTTKGDHLTIRTRTRLVKDGPITGDPLDELRTIMSHYRFVDVEGLPRFCGGFIGYVGYDVVRFFEPRVPDTARDDMKLPDSVFMLADSLVIFDHVMQRIKVVANAHITDTSAKGIDAAYRSAAATIDKVIHTLRQPVKPPQTRAKRSRKLTIRSTMTKEAFTKAVKKTKRYITEGDIIQGVIAQRFSAKVTVPTLDIYRSLRSINPSPYMFYLKLGDVSLVGSSPEIFVRVEDGHMKLRPIAGTRPRGVTDAEDEALACDLLSDPKECAEHIMLVDLGRNDLGRVAEYGSVSVPELMVIEKYSHVMHIVSDCVGRLQKDKDAFDVIRASFPAGTVSGAPKIRAMEIIDELEPTRRGPYAGMVGYFSFSGNLDSCITIRTIVVHKNRAYVQAGAGIVADSKPVKEYQETINKAQALMKAIELAENGLE